jgi:hypothetical protein
MEVEAVEEVAAEAEVEALAEVAASTKMSTEVDIVVVVLEEVLEAVVAAVAVVELIAHAAPQLTASIAAVWEILAHVTDLQAVMDLDTLCVAMAQVEAPDAAAAENIIIY